MISEFRGGNERLGEVKVVLEKNPSGMTIKGISDEIGMNRNSVAKYLEILTISGEAERRNIGPAKVYKLSDNVPLSAMLDYSDECILVLDEEMKVVRVNKRFFEKFDFEREEVIDEPAEDIEIPMFDRTEEDGGMPTFPEESVLPDIQTALSEKKKRSTEIDMECDEGRFSFDVDIIPTTFHSGRTGVTLICKDITKRKEAENELKEYRKRLEELVKDRAKEIRRTKERLSSLINASNDSIYMVDEECRYIIANDEILDRIGVDENDLIGSKFEEFHTEKETEEFREKVKSVFEKGEMVRHRHSWDDPERHFLRTMSPVRNPDTDEVENVAVVSKDMTSFCDCPICGFNREINQ